MPQSPYQITIHPPVQSLGQYREVLARSRVSYEDGTLDRDAEGDLLEAGESLLGHCEFLESKLDVKVRLPSLFLRSMAVSLTGSALQKRDLDQLVKENENLKRRVEDLKRQGQAQKEEITALTNDLGVSRKANDFEVARKALEEYKEQSDSGTEGDEAPTSPHNNNSMAAEVEKLGSRHNFSIRAGLVPRPALAPLDGAGSLSQRSALAPLDEDSTNYLNYLKRRYETDATEDAKKLKK